MINSGVLVDPMMFDVVTGYVPGTEQSEGYD